MDAPPVIADYTWPRRAAVRASRSIGNRHGKFSCPKCGSLDTTCKKEMLASTVAVGLLCFMLAFLLVPLLPYNCRCAACGHRWKP